MVFSGSERGSKSAIYLNISINHTISDNPHPSTLDFEINWDTQTFESIPHTTESKYVNKEAT